ncbi:hypothetical protein BV22DRAFT_1128459 [Leucogyrophana mollusca]|uniref:Uncharacterized protein n=1 Tax=Leucogyrophana mollusca TaxID=85980 RepID=A0ACB8BLE5_9AGAM|nr:hypothetical protein BV22DRAFT_1128459 [Leucogyrophana mollusca]
MVSFTRALIVSALAIVVASKAPPASDNCMDGILEDFESHDDDYWMYVFGVPRCQWTKGKWEGLRGNVRFWHLDRKCVKPAAKLLPLKSIVIKTAPHYKMALFSSKDCSGTGHEVGKDNTFISSDLDFAVNSIEIWV